MPQLATNAGAPAPPKVEMKKKRKPRMRITGRVCTHCGATKTTEWRMGPEGRGTLCNAYVVHLCTLHQPPSRVLTFFFFFLLLVVVDVGFGTARSCSWTDRRTPTPRSR
jgi:hypothetical protein